MRYGYVGLQSGASYHFTRHDHQYTEHRHDGDGNRYRGVTWYVGTALQMNMRRAHFVEEINHKLTRFFEALSIRPLEHDRRCWPVLARTL